MQYASLGGKKSMPTETGQRAECPGCGGEVLSKCGEIVIHHWAHLSGVDCDPWAEYETEWHRDWKNLFPEAWREVNIKSTFGSESHRADVSIPNGPVIEFQHSSLSPKQIREREKFYNKHSKGILWVVDGSEFMDRWIKYNWNQWIKESYLKGKEKKWFEDYSPFTHVYEIDRYDGFSLCTEDNFRDHQPCGVNACLLKPVRWPHARKTWAFAGSPVYFDSGRRDKKPERGLISEEFHFQTYTDQQERDISRVKPGSPQSKYIYKEKYRKVYRYEFEENEYPDSDIFEWLGTVNDGAATCKKFYDKQSNGHKSRINSRKALNLPKYIVGRFKPFDTTVTELKNLGDIV